MEILFLLQSGNCYEGEKLQIYLLDAIRYAERYLARIANPLWRQVGSGASPYSRVEEGGGGAKPYCLEDFDILDFGIGLGPDANPVPVGLDIDQVALLHGHLRVVLVSLGCVRSNVVEGFRRRWSSLGNGDNGGNDENSGDLHDVCRNGMQNGFLCRVVVSEIKLLYGAWTEIKSFVNLLPHYL